VIRAHLATFPKRQHLLLDAVKSIAPQVDRVFVCLNEFTAPPPGLDEVPNLEYMIPDEDLKDAGKFAFSADADDIIFTIDDDIIYADDYVERTLAFTDQLDLETNTIGYQAHAFVFKKQEDRLGWRNFAFGKKCPQIFKVDLLGTGTACLLGKNCPTLAEIQPCAGFVDLRFSRLQTKACVTMWVLPRDEGYLTNNLPDALWETSLFNTVNLKRPENLKREVRQLLQERTPHSGLKLDKVLKERSAQ
jgi:hypothetical protein